MVFVYNLLFFVVHRCVTHFIFLFFNCSFLRTKQDSNLYGCGFNAVLYHWSYSSVLFDMNIDWSLFPHHRIHPSSNNFAESKGFEPLHRINDVQLSRLPHYHSANSPILQRRERDSNSWGCYTQSVFKTASMANRTLSFVWVDGFKPSQFCNNRFTVCHDSSTSSHSHFILADEERFELSTIGLTSRRSAIELYIR